MTLPFVGDPSGGKDITQSKIHIGMWYKGSAAAETMMTKAAS